MTVLREIFENYQRKLSTRTYALVFLCQRSYSEEDKRYLSAEAEKGNLYAKGGYLHVTLVNTNIVCKDTHCMYLTGKKNFICF